MKCRSTISVDVVDVELMIVVSCYNYQEFEEIFLIVNGIILHNQMNIFKVVVWLYQSIHACFFRAAKFWKQSCTLQPSTS